MFSELRAEGALGSSHLEPGFNVIVGLNNVGKTVLAEAVGLRLANKPHRSLDTVPTLGVPQDPLPWVEASIRPEAEDLRRTVQS